MLDSLCITISALVNSHSQGWAGDSWCGPNIDEHLVVIREFDLIHEVLLDSNGHVYSGRPGGFRMDELTKGVGIPVPLDLDPTVKKIDS